jgi:hypothetical protein
MKNKQKEWHPATKLLLKSRHPDIFFLIKADNQVGFYELFILWLQLVYVYLAKGLEDWKKHNF